MGAMYYWSSSLRHEYDPIGLSSPYFTRDYRGDVAPKWVAYWINPAATTWTYWAIRFTGRLYVPWRNIQVAVHVDDDFYLRLCSIIPSNWIFGYPTWYHTLSGTCDTTSGVYDFEMGFLQYHSPAQLVFIIGPGGDNKAYIPTIDGAWYCPSFDWSAGRCNVAWSFVPASPSVPYFVGTNYTPSSTNDGGGTPGP